jgi:ATP/maltotriose-dependent transcriptional regulator MalT
MATVSYQEGDLSQAKSEFEQLAAASAAAGDRFGSSLSQVELANVPFAQGNIAEAKKMYQESLATTQEVGDQESSVVILENIAGILLVQGDLAGAHKSAEEAMEVAQKLGEKNAVVEAQGTLATVLLEEGRAADAETLARRSADTLGAERAAMKQAFSRSLLAVALLAQSSSRHREESASGRPRIHPHSSRKSASGERTPRRSGQKSEGCARGSRPVGFRVADAGGTAHGSRDRNEVQQRCHCSSPPFGG